MTKNEALLRMQMLEARLAKAEVALMRLRSRWEFSSYFDEPKLPDIIDAYFKEFPPEVQAKD